MKNIMSNSTRLKNANYLAWSKSAVLMSSLLRMWPEPVRRSCALTLLAVGTLLTGCAHNPMPPCLQPSPATMPVLSEPIPSVSYSLSVQQNIKRWASALTGTPATSKP